MPHVRVSALSRSPDALSTLAGESLESSSSLAASPYAMPGFFVGWVALGLLVAALLVVRGHDARTMVALGAGLGPLMGMVVWSRARLWDPAATTVVVERGRDHGGPLDVYVLVQGDAADVASIVPTLEATRDDLGTLTLARAVAYEWVDGVGDDAVVRDGASTLAAAAALVPVDGAELALWPGTVDAVADRMRRGGRVLVLRAIAEPSAGSTVSA